MMGSSNRLGDGDGCMGILMTLELSARRSSVETLALADKLTVSNFPFFLPEFRELERRKLPKNPFDTVAESGVPRESFFFILGV